jgi:hypothetical protein
MERVGRRPVLGHETLDPGLVAALAALAAHVIFVAV